MAKGAFKRIKKLKEPDQFQAKSGNFIRWVNERQKLVLILVILIVGSAFGLTFYKDNWVQNSKDAAGMLFNLENEYTKSKDQKQYENKLNLLLEQFPSTVASSQARFKLGRLRFRDAQYAKAVDHFLGGISRQSDNTIKAAAYLGVAVSYEGLRDWKSAELNYRKVLDQNIEGFSSEALFALGKGWFKADDPNKGRKFLEQLISEKKSQVLVSKAQDILDANR